MRQMIPVLLLLTLLLPAAAAAQPPVTRAQFVAALWACAGGVPYDANGPFSDVERDSPGATAIAWAYDLGVVQGTGGACFTPDRPVTREEAAMFLRRYAAHLGRDTFLPGGAAACNDLRTSPLGGTTPCTGPRPSACWSGQRRPAGPAGVRLRR